MKIRVYNRTQYIFGVNCETTSIAVLSDINILLPRKYANIRSFYAIYIMNLYKEK